MGRSQSQKEMKGVYMVLSFMFNILADVKLNCWTVRECRNYFGEKIFWWLVVSFFRSPHLAGLAYLSLWKTTLYVNPFIHAKFLQPGCGIGILWGGLYPMGCRKVFTDCRVFMFVNTSVKVLRLDFSGLEVLSGKFLVYGMLFIKEHNLGLNPQTDFTCAKLFV